MKTPREDPDCDHAQRVVARKDTITVEGWMQSTRRLSVAESEFKGGVKGALILLGAKSMMMTMMAMLGCLARIAVQPRVPTSGEE